ncbi:UNVERIFIED_CONTAM: hypothetical protein K2H54_072250 [Gekko kuhli]
MTPPPLPVYQHLMQAACTCYTLLRLAGGARPFPVHGGVSGVRETHATGVVAQGEVAATCLLEEGGLAPLGGGVSSNWEASSLAIPGDLPGCLNTKPPLGAWTLIQKSRGLNVPKGPLRLCERSKGLKTRVPFSHLVKDAQRGEKLALTMQGPLPILTA